METLRKHLEELGEFVTQHSDASSQTQLVLADVQSRLTRRREQTWNGFALAALLAAAATAVSIAALVLLSKSRPITYEVSRVAEATGGWIVTTSESAHLDFSEGTRVTLEPDTRLRVSDSRESGATVVIEQGKVVARVEHEGAHRDWRFHAGPYLVQVTGTAFEVSWDVSSSMFELALHEGSVVVSGPQLPGDRVVRAGSTLRVSPLGQARLLLNENSVASPAATQRVDSLALEKARRKTPPSQLETTDSTSPPAPRATSSLVESSAVSPVPQHSAAQSPERLKQQPTVEADAQQPRWRKALREGRPSEAIQVLLKSPTSPDLGDASLDELWQIADTARLGGHPALAQTALVELRQSHKVRGQTAYLLGKMAVDQRSAPNEAIQWFKTSLEEEPNGPLAEQALGRLVELGAGTVEGRAHAREYIKRFPDGAFAPFARSQLVP